MVVVWPGAVPEYCSCWVAFPTAEPLVVAALVSDVCCEDDDDVWADAIPKQSNNVAALNPSVRMCSNSSHYSDLLISRSGVRNSWT